jgi:AcrR family transcriptional regulator
VETAPPPRRERKKARTRRQILAAARARFLADGFDAVTVEQVCDAADVARGTFFAHFGSKAALLDAWCEGLAAELAERLRDARGSARAEYRALVEQLADTSARRPDLALALLPALLASGALRALVEDVVRRGQQRGELRRNVPPRLAAAAALATCAAALAEGGPSDGPGARAERRGQLLNALLHGMAEPKPRLKWSAQPSRPA